MPDSASSSMLGLAAGLFSAATWALGSHLFARLLSRNQSIGAPAANLFKNGAALVFFLALGALLAWPTPTHSQIWKLALSGALGFAVGDALYFAAFKYCGVQLAALSANLIPPISALIAFVALGEVLTPRALVAMGFVIVGIVVVLLGRRGGQAGQAQRPGLGLALAAAAALVQSMSMVVARGALNELDGSFEALMSANVARLVGAVAGALAIAVAMDIVRPGRRELVGLAAPLKRSLFVPFLVATTVAAIVNLPAFTFALANLKVGVSAVLFGTTPLFTLPIGLALGARYGFWVWLGSAIAFGGLVLLVTA